MLASNPEVLLFVCGNEYRNPFENVPREFYPWLQFLHDIPYSRRFFGYVVDA